MRLSPSIAEPSKPMPSVNAPSTSAGAIATDFRVPTTSVNQSLTNLTPRSSMVRRTKSRCLSIHTLSRTSQRTGSATRRRRRRMPRVPDWPHVRRAPDTQHPTRSAGAEQNPYGGAAASGGPKRVRTRHFQNAKREGIKITGLTSYDQLTARIFDEAGIDFLLVGDSAGNNVFGYETTLPVTVDELIPLTRAVAGAVKRAFVVADMPFGSYENGPEDALHTAVRFMKETGAHAVKLEGGERSAQADPPHRRAPASRSWRTSATRRRASTGSAATSSRVAARASSSCSPTPRPCRTPARSPSCSRWCRRMPRGRSPSCSRSRRSASAPVRTPTASCSSGPTGPGLTIGRVPKFVKQYANLAGILSDAAKEWRADVEVGHLPERRAPLRVAAPVLELSRRRPPRPTSRCSRAGSRAPARPRRGSRTARPDRPTATRIPARPHRCSCCTRTVLDILGHRLILCPRMPPAT